jgi:hypothetical protein
LHSEANRESSDNGREQASTAVAYGDCANAICETDADPNPKGQSTLILSPVHRKHESQHDFQGL